MKGDVHIGHSFTFFSSVVLLFHFLMIIWNAFTDHCVHLRSSSAFAFLPRMFTRIAQRVAANIDFTMTVLTSLQSSDVYAKFHETGISEIRRQELDYRAFPEYPYRRDASVKSVCHS